MANVEIWRKRCRLGLFAFYGFAGFLHLAFPAPFLSITPDWVPDASDVIMLTGVCEIAGAIGLLMPQTRRYAGTALALYAILVFPANLKHAADSLSAPATSSWQWAYHCLRLPLQPLIVWLAIFSGGRKRPRHI